LVRTIARILAWTRLNDLV